MIGKFRDVGIKGINIAFRPPIDWDALQHYIEEVMPAFLRLYKCFYLLINI